MTLSRPALQRGWQSLASAAVLRLQVLRRRPRARTGRMDLVRELLRVLLEGAVCWLIA